jgi:hypothetical protein
MEYKGFEIRVSPGDVVLGEDPMGAVTDGFVAEVCKMDPVQDDPEGRPMLDYPFGVAASHLRGATEDEAVAKAKAFIDASGKPKHFTVTGSEA